MAENFLVMGIFWHQSVGVEAGIVFSLQLDLIKSSEERVGCI
jgi:hypothetical protein